MVLSLILLKSPNWFLLALLRSDRLFCSEKVSLDLKLDNLLFCSVLPKYQRCFETENQSTQLIFGGTFVVYNLYWRYEFFQKVQNNQDNIIDLGCLKTERRSIKKSLNGHCRKTDTWESYGWHDSYFCFSCLLSLFNNPPNHVIQFRRINSEEDFKKTIEKIPDYRIKEEKVRPAILQEREDSL